MSTGEGEGIGYTTARGRDWPSVRQFNVFLENRLGALLEVVRHFETTDIRIVSLTIVDSADCAIVRIVLSDPERAFRDFRASQAPVYRDGPVGRTASEWTSTSVADLQSAPGRRNQYRLRLPAARRSGRPRRASIARGHARSRCADVDQQRLCRLHRERSESLFRLTCGGGDWQSQALLIAE